MMIPIAPLEYEVHELSSGYSAIIYDRNGTAVADHLMEDQAAFIVRAVNAHQHLIEALQSAREYFDNLSDADHDGDGFVPNAEMRLVSEIDEALAKAGAA